MTNFGKTLAVTISVIGTLAATSPAYAAMPQADQVETKISASQLRTERGVQKIYQQLQTTAERKCAVNGRMTLSSIQIANSCSAQLLTDFVNSVGNDALTALHNRTDEQN